MIITNDIEFETALEEVMNLWEQPITPDTEARLFELVQALKGYEPVFGEPEPDGVMTEERARLEKRLSDFEHHWRKRSDVMTDVDALLSPLFGRRAQAGDFS